MTLLNKNVNCIIKVLILASFTTQIILYRLCLAFILRERSLLCGFGGRCVPAEETAINYRYSELRPKGTSSVYTAHCTCMYGACVCVHVYMQWYMYVYMYA
jgi:hypothetical protein